ATTPAAPVAAPEAPAAPVAAPSTPAAEAEVVDGGVTPAAYVSAAARWAILAALLFSLPCLVAGPSLVGARLRP
ncbi:MAG: hypothetical protein QM572_15180, partial [Nocardioides sp.]|uniref:hypothetical protein n=1 Tax=Nocardioides sp. TaxID=35761 RepID=UPI0039E6332C